MRSAGGRILGDLYQPWWIFISFFCNFFRYYFDGYLYTDKFNLFVLELTHTDILEQCRIREDNIAHEKYQREQLELLTSENKALNNEVKTLSDEVSRLRKLLEENGIKSE